MTVRLNARQRRLVESNLQLVSTIAKHVTRSLPVSVTVAELESVGYLALCRAAISHQAVRGPFDYWAKLKINGAMIDANKGSKYARRFVSATPQFPLYFSNQDVVNLQAVGLQLHIKEQLLLDASPNPEQALIARQERQAQATLISNAIRSLSKPEQRILEASDNDITLGEIAEELGVGITTVHRRRETIYAKLRRFLVEHGTNSCYCETTCTDPETKRKCHHPSFRGLK